MHDNTPATSSDPGNTHHGTPHIASPDFQDDLMGADNTLFPTPPRHTTPLTRVPVDYLHPQLKHVVMMITCLEHTGPPLEDQVF